MTLWIVFVVGVGIAGSLQLFWAVAHDEQPSGASVAGGVAGFFAFLQLALVGGAVLLALVWLVRWLT